MRPSLDAGAYISIEHNYGSQIYWADPNSPAVEHESADKSGLSTTPLITNFYVDLDYPGTVPPLLAVIYDRMDYAQFGINMDGQSSTSYNYGISSTRTSTWKKGGSAQMRWKGVAMGTGNTDRFSIQVMLAGWFDNWEDYYMSSSTFTTIRIMWAQIGNINNSAWTALGYSFPTTTHSVEAITISTAAAYLQGSPTRFYAPYREYYPAAIYVCAAAAARYPNNASGNVGYYYPNNSISPMLANS